MANSAIKNDIGDVSIALLERARQRAQIFGVPYAGVFYPPEAWTLHNNGAAILLDVRTPEERKFVGRVPETPHIPWKIGQDLAQNKQFLKQVRAMAPKETILLLLCRSGGRSAEAAEALTKAGYVNAFNVLEGFEGELDNHQQRGTYNGWRHHRLPWIQD